MRRLAFLSLLIAGCLTRNYQACDAEHHDCPIGQTCNMQKFKCEDIVDSDGGDDDMGVGDLGDADSAVDASLDLARECDTNSQCGDPSRPVCTQAGQCRSCNGSDTAACSAHSLNVCEADAGRCAECTPTTQATYCTNSQKPFCGSDGTCRGCQKDSECPSDVCLSDGSCAAATDIFYVDNGGQPVATCKGAGTHNGMSKTTAFCDIQDAVTANTRKLLKVYGHVGASYGQVAITAGDWTIIGPGVGVSEPVIIFPTSTVPGVSLNASAAASLTLIGVEVGSRTLSSSDDAVSCTKGGSGAVTLTMRNSAAQNAGATKHGVQSNSCTVILDGNRIAFNAGGGINLSVATKYTITNNFIYRNGSTAVFVDSSSTANGTFQFNTVAHNTKSTAGGGGIECGTATPLIESSIFWANTPSESAGSCVFVNSDVGTIDPGFVNEAMDDYRLNSANVAIIDKVTAIVDGGGPLPDHDFFGTHRPLGNGWDIGAHEKQ